MVLIFCPHCGDCFEIDKVRCGIFRHAVLKKTMKPHTSDEDMKKYEKLIYGCGKQFTFDECLVKNEQPSICK
jgi:hypothetical protein